MKILSMPKGGVARELRFPPADDWTGTGSAFSINVSSTALSCGDMSSGQYADFTKPFDGSDSARTITANFVCGVNTRQVFIYIDGVQAAYETVSANTTKLVSCALPAGNHTVIFRILNGGWSSTGGGYFNLITCN